MTTHKLSRLAVVLLTCAIAGSGASAQSVNPDAKVIADFTSRVNSYMELHKRLRKDAPPLKETKNPAEIQASQEVLAAKIREARKTAKPGEIFTPEVRALFRRLMYPETKGPQGAETKQSIKDDSPARLTLKVNASYPESAPLPTVPPNVLAALPKLPEELEYRIVNTDLILRDVHANLIVDFAQKAIQ